MSSLDAIGNGTLIDWQHQKSKMHSILEEAISPSARPRKRKQIKRKKWKWQDLSICASVRELLICFVSQQDDDDDIERRPAIPQSRVRVRWLWKSRERHKYRLELSTENGRKNKRRREAEFNNKWADETRESFPFSTSGAPKTVEGQPLNLSFSSPFYYIALKQQQKHQQGDIWSTVDFLGASIWKLIKIPRRSFRFSLGQTRRPLFASSLFQQSVTPWRLMLGRETKTKNHLPNHVRWAEKRKKCPHLERIHVR